MVEVPPLRERREDVRAFAQHFLALRGETEALPEEVLEALSARSWPGNVRELRNVLDRLLVSAGSPSGIRASDVSALPEKPGASRAVSPHGEDPTGDWSLASVERRQIERALAAFGWNQTKAAEALGVSVRTLYRKIRELGLRAPGASL
jgi:transcriptional regulator with PAS, ATPase and Fis domain